MTKAKKKKKKKVKKKSRKNTYIQFPNRNAKPPFPPRINTKRHTHTHTHSPAHHCPHKFTNAFPQLQILSRIPPHQSKLENFGDGRMCYVGKATKIFVFIVAILVITGLVLGFTLLRHHGIRKKSHDCYSDSCAETAPIVFPAPDSNPSSAAPNPSGNSNPPPPPQSESSGSTVPDSPPPPSDNSSPSVPDLSPPPPALTSPPPPMPTVYPPPPAVVSAAPPPAFSPPNPVPAAPGPVNNS
ncbi:leucine-rich repeat extensin-like protein 1 [Salvia miltiorrhiza]|uniref:leucine-rich repeat extensin-like protein 1 n=1 Tax=Salvia miltiorrhiza TaxID=226208 RepID=UPI0025AC19E7|nr:leucine-rich repeat extensin-like protein 1 [Salvia miltiorrhiza]